MALGRRVRAVGRQGLAGEAERARTSRRVADRAARRVRRGRPPVGGVDAARALARKRARQRSSIPRSARLLCADAGRRSSAASTRLATWNAVIAAEPALAVVLVRRASSMPRCCAIADFVDLKSPYTLGHSRPSPSSPAAAAAQLGLARRRGRSAAARRARPRLRAAGRVELDLGQARAARRRRVGAGADAAVPHRAHAAPVRRAGAARRDRGRSTASGSTAPATRAALRRSAISRPARILGAADAYQAMREPRPHRAARSAPTRPPRELRAEVRAGRSTATRSRRCSRRRPPRRGAARARPGSPRARSRCCAARPRAVEQGDRRAAGDLAEDRRQPHRAHLRQDRRVEPGDRQPVRHAARAAARAPSVEPAREMGQVPHDSAPPPAYVATTSRDAGGGQMALRSRLFAATYDRKIAKVERPGFGARRRALLTERHRDVLEIGGGTGANLPLLPRRASSR